MGGISTDCIHKANNSGRQGYYLFLGFHAFLIGLFPFFLPVYLVKNGRSLIEISSFIGYTGLFFVLTLYCWDRLLRKIPPAFSILLSFAAELALLFLLTINWEQEPLMVLALVNGVYTCLFWMVQRIHFLARGAGEGSGRRFGNFQIFVTLLLKFGIFIGGVLLEHVGIVAVCLLSVISTIVALLLLRGSRALGLPQSIRAGTPLTLISVVSFKDEFRSRPVFVFDGVFLYLESYFWLISLFHLTRQSYQGLSVLVIALAVGFTLLFYLIKNRIDVLPTQWVYGTAVGLYVLSWILRGVVEGTDETGLLYLLLIAVTFSTSFFRLCFNKRFFDLAAMVGGYSYLFYKSYISQFCLGCFFLLLSPMLIEESDLSRSLSVVYLGAAVLAPVYLLYRPHKLKSDYGDNESFSGKSNCRVVKTEQSPLQ